MNLNQNFNNKPKRISKSTLNKRPRNSIQKNISGEEEYSMIFSNIIQQQIEYVESKRIIPKKQFSSKSKIFEERKFQRKSNIIQDNEELLKIFESKKQKKPKKNEKKGSFYKVYVAKNQSQEPYRRNKNIKEQSVPLTKNYYIKNFEKKYNDIQVINHQKQNELQNIIKAIANIKNQPNYNLKLLSQLQIVNKNNNYLQDQILHNINQMKDLENNIISAEQQIKIMQDETQKFKEIPRGFQSKKIIDQYLKANQQNKYLQQKLQKLCNIQQLYPQKISYENISKEFVVQKLLFQIYQDKNYLLLWLNHFAEKKNNKFYFYNQI